MIVTDEQGNRFYPADEAAKVMGVSRSTFGRLAAELKKYKRDRDRKVYYRVEDVEALKSRPAQIKPIDPRLGCLAGASC